MKRGDEWFIREDWTPYFDWLEPRLKAGRWAVMPDAPGAPTQLNDALRNQWPFGVEYGVPLYHMDAPVERLLRLLEKHPRVALGWIGDRFKEPVGCEGWFRKMDEIAVALGNDWPVLHMMRGVLVAREYPFKSADATSNGQNGHRYDDKMFNEGFRGRAAYADRLERGDFPIRVRSKMHRNREAARRGHGAQDTRSRGDGSPDQLGLW